jgi:choline dehydrogenase-like flavoprotein
LRALEWSAAPRRFTCLAPDRASAHLRALERSRSGVKRDVFLALKTLACLPYARDERVLAAAGVSASCEVDAAAEPADAEVRAPALRAQDLIAPDGAERCDVVIVGSGAGGASAARVLAERGLDVIVVERGPYVDAALGYPTDPVAALEHLYREGGLTVAEGRPAIPLPVAWCVGGTTVINSGTCLRPPPDVLATWRDEHGVAWATELDGELTAVERALAVAPVDPATAGRNAALCRTGAQALGFSNGPLPRNAGGVTRCGTCPTGCVRDAKRAAHVSELPRAVAAGARVRANRPVLEVVVRDGRAVGVRCRGYEVAARAVVLAAGALGTPELLLRQGLANRSGAVGRHLRIHPACWVGGRFDEPVRGWEGIMQSWHVDEWLDRGLFLEATHTPLAFGAHWLGGAGDELAQRIERYDQLGVIGVHLSERSEGRVGLRGGRPRVTYRLRDEDAATLRFGIARAADIHFAAGAREVYPQVGRVAALAPGEQKARIESADIPAAELRLEAFHPMGTARMGADPASSVVAPTGEAHDVPGLYVADASLFPTSLKVNPMLTIMACARRIAAGLADTLTGAG